MVVSRLSLEREGLGRGDRINVHMGVGEGEAAYKSVNGSWSYIKTKSKMHSTFAVFCLSPHQRRTDPQNKIISMIRVIKKPDLQVSSALSAPRAQVHIHSSARNLSDHPAPCRWFSRYRTGLHRLSYWIDHFTGGASVFRSPARCLPPGPTQTS